MSTSTASPRARTAGTPTQPLTDERRTTQLRDTARPVGGSPDTTLTSAPTGTQPGQPPANSAPSITEQTVRDLRSKDPKARGAALEAFQQAAASGDPKALRQLQQQLSDNSDVRFGLGYDERRNIERTVVDGLAKAAERGDANAMQGLAQGLHGSHDVREASQQALAAAAKRGDANALATLRKEATGDRYGAGQAAADALAQADPKLLTADDYKLLAQQGLGQVSDSPARDALIQGAKEGRPGALEALRAPLSQQDGSRNLRSQQEQAAEALAQMPDKVTDSDVTNLQRLATNSDDASLRKHAFDAIAGAAGRQPPSAQAQEAVLAIANDVHATAGQYKARSLDDPYRDIRHSLRNHVSHAFDQAATPALKEQLAPHVLRHELNNPARAKAAVDTLAPKALAGNTDAISALAEHVGTSGYHEGREHSLQALNEAARAGQAGPIADQLIQQYRQAGNSDQGRGLEVLGQVGQHLQEGDPRLNQVRQALRGGVSTPLGSDRRGKESAEQGMRAMADRLQREDVNALVQNLNHYNADTLSTAARTMSTADRDALRNDLRGQLGNGFRGDSAAKAMSDMSQHLRPEDVDALSQQYRTRGERDRAVFADAMKSVLDDPAANKSAQAAAARTFMDAPKETLRPEDFNSVVNYAAGTDNQPLKNELLSRLPQGVIQDRHLNSVAKEYGETIGNYMKYAREGSDWNNMAKLLTARKMASDPEWRKHVDVAAVDRQINALANGPLKDDLARIRERAIRHNVSSTVPKEQEAYMSSDAFQQRLKLLSPEQQRATLNRELGNLQGLDPAAAQRVSDHLAGSALRDNSMGIFRNMQGNPEQQASALQASIQNIAKGTKVTTGTTKKLVGLLNSMEGINDPTRAGRRLIEGLENAQDAARQAGNVQELAETSRALELVKNLNSRGQLSTALAGASLVGLAAGGAPKNAEEWAGAASDVMGVLGDASDIGKLFRVSDATQLGKGLKFLEPLGPVGDLVGAGVDAYGSYKDFNQGDYVGGGAKAVGAGAGLAGAAAGAAILAGASGPAAPAVLLGAALVGLGAWGVDAFFGKSDEQSMLENLGVWK